jgi:hypothetical protein
MWMPIDYIVKQVIWYRITHQFAVYTFLEAPSFEEGFDPITYFTLY